MKSSKHFCQSCHYEEVAEPEFPCRRCEGVFKRARKLAKEIGVNHLILTGVSDRETYGIVTVKQPGGVLRYYLQVTDSSKPHGATGRYRKVSLSTTTEAVAVSRRDSVYDLLKRENLVVDFEGRSLRLNSLEVQALREALAHSFAEGIVKEHDLELHRKLFPEDYATT